MQKYEIYSIYTIIIISFLSYGDVFWRMRMGEEGVYMSMPQGFYQIISRKAGQSLAEREKIIIIAA